MFKSMVILLVANSNSLYCAKFSYSCFCLMTYSIDGQDIITSPVIYPDSCLYFISLIMPCCCLAHESLFSQNIKSIFFFITKLTMHITKSVNINIIKHCHGNRISQGHIIQARRKIHKRIRHLKVGASNT